MNVHMKCDCCHFYVRLHNWTSVRSNVHCSPSFGKYYHLSRDFLRGKILPLDLNLDLWWKHTMFLQRFGNAA